MKTLFIRYYALFPILFLDWRAAVFILLISSTAVSGQSFGPFTAYSSGNYVIPLDVALADVNGDSKADIILAGGGSNAVGVLLNTGTGAFQPVVRYSTGGGTYPQGVAIGDVNNDSKLDIITANYLNNSVGILLGNGNGTFQAVVTYATGSYTAPADVALGDVNYDGKLDIIVANYNNSTVGILLNNGNSTFQSIVTYPAGANCNPNSLVAVDVNGDSKIDIITGNYFGDAISVLINDGYGSFKPTTLYTTSASNHTYNIAVADLNNDNKPDIITANTNDSAIGVMLGNGNGTFQSMINYVTGPNQYSYDVAIADITGDTKPDMVVVNGSSNAAEVLPGNGDGTFQLFRSFFTGSSSAPNKVAIADLNGDNKLDIVTGNNNNNTISVLLSTTALATQSFTSQFHVDFWPNPASVDEAIILSTVGLPADVDHLETAFLNSTGQRVFSITLPVVQGVTSSKLLTAGLRSGLYILRPIAYNKQGKIIYSLPVRQLCIK